jgi:hypothetical protein
VPEQPHYRLPTGLASVSVRVTGWPTRLTSSSNGALSRVRYTLLAVLELFLQVFVALRRPLRCDLADDGYERHADPVSFEVECDLHTIVCCR